jgi:hypothetical protein
MIWADGTSRRSSGLNTPSGPQSLTTSVKSDVPLGTSPATVTTVADGELKEPTSTVRTTPLWS